jgi:FkbH-like protein
MYSNVYDEKSKLYQFSPEFILFLLDEKIITEKLNTPWRAEDMQNTCEEVRMILGDLLNKLTQTNALLIINSIILSKNTLNLITDYQSKTKVLLAIETINYYLANYALSHKNVIYLDTNQFLQNPNVCLRDERLAFYAGTSLHGKLLDALADETFKIIKAKLGLSKKTLIVDLDNTLWGGILGDDGFQNITLGGEYEGAAYLAFQKTIKQIASQGVLLGIASKNDQHNVEEVFLKKPEMFLTKNDFVSIKANWQAKHENIVEIAKDLNLNIDSFVFVDDSAFECESVKNALSEISCINLPTDPSLFPQELLNVGYFNKLEITNEDLARTESYLSDNKRKDLSKQAGSLEDFLYKLDINLHIFSPNEAQLDRLSQLSMRTNQFNLSGLKFTNKEIENFLNNKKNLVLGAEYEDKFGNSGVIAAAFVEHNDNIMRLEIKNILLSCRVFSRGIEDAILHSIIKHAKNLQINEVIGNFIPTKKNAYAKDFYSRNNFKVLDLESGQYSISQENFKLIKKPEWVNIKSTQAR